MHKVEMVKLKNLIPDDRNARLHNERNIDEIRRSLAEFGQHRPFVVQTGTNRVIVGNGMLEAALSLGWKEGLVLYVDDDNLTAIRRGIADNRTAELAEWDEEKLAKLLVEVESYNTDVPGFSADEINELCSHALEDYEGKGEGTEGLTDPDEVPEEPKEPIAKPGDVWLLGHHRLMCGDSTDEAAVKRLMAGEKADMVFTDPPYGVSYADKNAFLNAQDKGNRIQTPIENDHLSLEEIKSVFLKAFCNIKEALAKRSSYYITAPQGGDILLTMMMMMQKAGLPLRHCLIWVKNNHVLGRTDYNYKHEPILYGWCEVHDFYGKGEHKFSTWEIPKPWRNDLHPTMKPVALVENAILNSTKGGQSVLDLFGGSGSTLIACEKTGRKCYMMEVDPKYCDVIIRRWEDFTGEKATLEGQAGR